MNRAKYKKAKQRIFEIIQIGQTSDLPSRIFDMFIVLVIVCNLAVTIMFTFDSCECYKDLLDIIEFVTVIIFTVEYILRIWTADYLYSGMKGGKARLKFFLSFYGLIDFLTFFPYYLPIIFPAGIVAFRMLRVIRVFRLFKINTKYDAFNVIVDVIYEKKNQIFSSICMIFILMVASSLCMYSLEHEAQPEQFKNALSGIWWSMSTLLTIGYGDIYPITAGGKLMAMFISFLGVGTVAIPTGIISAGFVEQYAKMKQNEEFGEEKNIQLIDSCLESDHPWVGKCIKDITMPPSLLLALILRDGRDIIPRGPIKLKAGDTLIFGAIGYEGGKKMNLRELEMGPNNPWIGLKIKELDISKLEIIVMIVRDKKKIIPNGETVIEKDDLLIMFSKHINKFR